MKVTTKSLPAAIVGAIAVFAIFSSAAYAGEEHGHCSGPNVCAGDAACEKQGWKDLTKDECAKIDGAKFEPSAHAGETHADAPHDDSKK